MPLHDWTKIGLWGVYHGSMLILWHAVKWPSRLRGLGKRIPRAFWIFVYFHVTLGSLFIFRAKSVHQIGDFLYTIFTGFGGLTVHIVPPSAVTQLAIPVFLLLDYLAYRANNERFFVTWPPSARGALYALLSVFLLMGFSNAPAEFIYFKF